jgi:hypothetical protein
MFGSSSHRQSAPAGEMAPSRPLPLFVLALFSLCLIAGLFALNDLAPASRRLIKLGGLDAYYYYADAHSLLFDRDFDLRNELRVLKPPVSVFPGWKGADGMPGSPWAVGYPILSIPFLAAGTIADALDGRPSDGYGTGALTAYFLANVIFVCAGLLFQAKFLERSGAGPWPAALISLAMWPLTSLIYYTYSPLSHAATFLMTAAFLYAWTWVQPSGRLRDWFLFGLCGGLMSICRWQDGAFLIAPFLLAVCARRLMPLQRWLAFGAGIAVCWIPQIVQWKVVYGKFVTMPYGPGFSEFPPRHALDVLFSSNHGWFVWTPAALLGVIGLATAARQLWPWLLVIAAEVGVLGSLPKFWNCTDSFGMRSLTSCVPLLALGIAVLWMKTRTGRGRAALAGIMAVCGVYTVLFAVQFRLDLIPHDGDLTVSQLLWDKVFLRRAYLRKKLSSVEVPERAVPAFAGRAH